MPNCRASCQHPHATTPPSPGAARSTDSTLARPMSGAKPRQWQAQTASRHSLNSAWIRSACCRPHEPGRLVSSTGTNLEGWFPHSKNLKVSPNTPEMVRRLAKRTRRAFTLCGGYGAVSGTRRGLWQDSEERRPGDQRRHPKTGCSLGFVAEEREAPASSALSRPRPRSGKSVENAVAPDSRHALGPRRSGGLRQSSTRETQKGPLPAYVGEKRPSKKPPYSLLGI